ncbi:carbonic anhydrase [Acidipropionibacterium acidipropionici]|jgi:carbonic anhydrase|uniref:carbonic anhydrase n=1 Tax=Acidipropionibacterium acidipropionici TaxID=1748 RepID=A0AAC9FBY2_9ACTN|nr:carbonic anhydrase [Acidipropionibacterium acidipropionici]AMS04603.1 carbonic anhydrase [Acidipropionibacterium acidipropionici]AOZ46093.1 carbonic anhydrase [Acidipropionibacterium acidipropionici]AZP37881.1 carbonic anhydrase [Acidipropionibacterium acidipropionici]
MGFNDLLAGNARFAAEFQNAGIPGRAARGVAVVTCMDSRLDPLAMLDLKVGDAKVLRTPGGRVTPEVVTGLVVGVHLLGVERIMVIAHSRCAMASGDDAQIADAIASADGAQVHGMAIGASTDQAAALAFDVSALRANPLIPAEVGGFMYDVDTGIIAQVH